MMLHQVVAICGVMLILAVAPMTTGAEPMDEAAAMEAWQKAATPGEFHAFLAKKSGNWQITGKMWMAPGTDPVVSESSAVAEMILGGRFLKEEMKGTSMGMPFEGLGITGYDNTTGLVTSVWYDNMGTVTSMFTGKYETPGAPLELTGSIFDAMVGMDMKVRSVTTFISDDASTFEFFVTPPGGAPEMLTMVLEYSRIE